MCLDTINPELEPVDEGYKVFHLDKRTNRLFSQCQGRPTCKYRGRWLDARAHSIYKKTLLFSAGSNHALYPNGWHSYLYLSDAKKRCSQWSSNVVARVKIREPLATGTQNGMPCTVSRYIKIEEVY